MTKVVSQNLSADCGWSVLSVVLPLFLGWFLDKPGRILLNRQRLVDYQQSNVAAGF